MIRWLPLLCVISLTSCAKLGKDGDAAKAEEQPFGSSGIPPQLRGKQNDPGTPILPIGPGGAPIPGHTPEEDIAFTNPDDLDGGLPELNTILAAPKLKAWEESETVAKRRAAREGKPVLMWFTDSSKPQMSAAISQELFSTAPFEEWAKEKVVRLRIDANARQGNDRLSMEDKINREAALKDYVETLKRRYKVLGSPTVVMLNPSGEVLGKYRGYKRGEADYFWGLLKQAEAVSSNNYKNWRSGLEKKGYRDWEDTKGRKIFAKLLSYSEGQLVLVEPDGGRFRTAESRLSRDDRDWIADQKKIRGVP